MVSIVGKNKQTAKQTASRGRTPAQILEDQSKPNAAAQASAELANANANKNTSEAVFADNLEVNALLTRAAQFGELLDKDVGFQSDAAEIARSKEVLDTQVITFLKHLDNALTKEQRALLPWPGSTKAEVEAKGKRSTNNETPFLYDKPKASGGRAKVETFYGNMIGHTTLGAQANKEIEAIQKEIDEAKVKPTGARLPANLQADMKRANAKRNNLLSALRTAAQTRIMIEDIKARCPMIMIEWIRNPMPDEDVDLSDKDLTLLNVPEAGDVVKSSTCLNIWTKPANPQLLVQAMKQAKPYSIGSFKRWKVDRAIEIAKANNRTTRVTVDDLIESAKAPPKAPPSTVPASATADKNTTAHWAQRDVVDVKRALDAMLSWYRGDSPVAQEAKQSELLKAINASDEMNGTTYALYKILRPIYETDKAKVDKAEAFWKAVGEKAA